MKGKKGLLATIAAAYVASQMAVPGGALKSISRFYGTDLAYGKNVPVVAITTKVRNPFSSDFSSDFRSNFRSNFRSQFRSQFPSDIGTCITWCTTCTTCWSGQHSQFTGQFDSQFKNQPHQNNPWDGQFNSQSSCGCSYCGGPFSANNNPCACS